MAEDTLIARLTRIRDWFLARANRHDAHTIAAAIAALTPPPADLVYAPYWLVALRACDEALDKHSLWCGHKKDSPGDPSINRAERLIRSALRRADAEAAAPPPAEAAPEPTPAGRETLGAGVVDWRGAALRIGEELAANGPHGYSKFTAEQWLAWALAALRGGQP